MSPRIRRTILISLLALAGLALLWLALRPKPVPVDLGEVSRGPLQVEVNAQGETRSHDRYSVAAPAAGKLLRIELHEGDRVQQNQIIARLAPSPLSARERDEQLARVAASAARVREASQEEQHAASEFSQAQRELARSEQLAKQGFIAPQALERAQTQVKTAQSAVEAARYRVRAATADATLAQAGLAALHTGADTLLTIRSPVSGTVLHIADRSERVVTPGTPLLTLGDLQHLEVVIEMLSSDAVQVQPGMPVLLDGWGGAQPVPARVRLVEPAAFTKLSTLGVEEKRTNVIADFVGPPPAPLGDGFRVNARVITWRADRVLQLPTSALFRCGPQSELWCCFTDQNGQARQQTVTLGQRTPLQSQVLSGVQAGDRIVLYPGNTLQNGSRIRSR